ncbi:hypothetical protein E2P47_02430, partial [Candidatus Bathyarchaeota archaeon]
KKDVEIHPWLSLEKRAIFMKNAKIIVFSGGHGTCFETVKYQKPSICIPTQPEQTGNAVKLEKLNCSILVRNQTELRKAFDTIESESKDYNSKVRELNNFSRKFNGLAQTVKIIESL